MPNKNRRAGISFREYLLKNMTFYFPSISGKPFMKIKKVQFVWWGTHWQGIGLWRYPRFVAMGTEIFIGLRLGVCEIRFFKI